MNRLVKLLLCPVVAFSQVVWAEGVGLNIPNHPCVSLKEQITQAYKDRNKTVMDKIKKYMAESHEDSENEAFCSELDAILNPTEASLTCAEGGDCPPDEEVLLEPKELPRRYVRELEGKVQTQSSGTGSLFGGDFMKNILLPFGLGFAGGYLVTKLMKNWGGNNNHWNQYPQYPYYPGNNGYPPGIIPPNRTGAPPWFTPIGQRPWTPGWNTGWQSPWGGNGGWNGRFWDNGNWNSGAPAVINPIGGAPYWNNGNGYNTSYPYNNSGVPAWYNANGGTSAGFPQYYNYMQYNNAPAVIPPWGG